MMLDNVRLAKYTEPTPVQKHGIPIVMGGRDMMACAQTVYCLSRTVLMTGIGQDGGVPGADSINVLGTTSGPIVDWRRAWPSCANIVDYLPDARTSLSDFRRGTQGESIS
jgi:hypothetical protein